MKFGKTGGLCPTFQLVWQPPSAETITIWYKVYIYIYIYIGNRKKNYTFISTSLFRDHSLFRAFNDRIFKTIGYIVLDYIVGENLNLNV